MEQPSHSPRQMVRIDGLPDDLLLETFDFYVNMHPPLFGKEKIEAWQTLVHVCRRWRILVLGSPRRLNLQLCCTPKTPTRHALNIWPALPLVICGNLELLSNTDSVIAALGQSNRVRRVFLWVFASRQLEGILAAMHVPFPELTDLRLLSNGDSETMPVIPDSLLGGSGPRLQHFSLNGIPFPGLPRLLFSATDLVTLWLFDIPHSGYISPEAIVALLSVLSSLDRLILEFESPQSRPDRESRRFPPSNHSVIPALSSLSFKGAIEYLEEFVTGIDTPQLEGMLITLFNQIDFDTPRLAQFINRTPKLMKTNAHVRLVDDFARVTLRVPTEYKFLEIRVSCREPDWQLSSIEQLCNSSFPLSTVEVLYIGHEYSKLVWKNDTIENTLWLQLLLPFTAVKNLYLSKDFAPEIASALQELVGSRTTEVLPNLQNILVEGLEPLGRFQENIGQFVAARQPPYHPIALSVWDKSSDMEWV